MSTKRGNGEGSLYKRSDGRWAGSVDLGWEGGKRRRKVVYGRTQAEALGKLRAAQASVKSNLPLPDERLTVGAHLDRWLAGLEGHVSANTLDNYRRITDKHIVPDLGPKRLARLTPTDVERLVRAKSAQGLSVSTVSRVRAVLVQSLKQAERWGLVARNVAALTDGPKQRGNDGRSLTVDQAKVLLAAVAGDRLEALYVVALSLGLRPGEVLGLAWADVDTEARTLHVRQAVKRETVNPLGPSAALNPDDPGKRTSRLVVGEVKTPKSRRALNLPAGVAAALVAHRRRHNVERLAAGPSWVDHGLVFPTATGGPIEPRNLRRRLSDLCVKAGLGHWHPHELRHSAASIMLAQGVPLEVVSEILGHASIRLTKDTYGHLVGPQMQDAADAIGRALFGS
ncbi:MAG: hypothetical protein QOJ67_2528 [Acidimicrobiaceae bacterium]|jgi:integrase